VKRKGGRWWWATYIIFALLLLNLLGELGLCLLEKLDLLLIVGQQLIFLADDTLVSLRHLVNLFIQL
jgi:hypothetical protein